jgi:hypothetical protein
MIKELKCFESKLQSTAAHQDKKEIQQHSNTGAKIHSHRNSSGTLTACIDLIVQKW